MATRDRQDERYARREAHRALGGEFPLDAKVTLVPRLRVGRDEREEEHALLDLAPDLRVPLVALFESAIGVEPHLHACAPQSFADAPRGLRVLRGVAEEHGLVGGIGHRVPESKRRTGVASERQRPASFDSPLLRSLADCVSCAICSAVFRRSVEVAFGTEVHSDSKSRSPTPACGRVVRFEADAKSAIRDMTPPAASTRLRPRPGNPADLPKRVLEAADGPGTATTRESLQG